MRCNCCFNFKGIWRHKAQSQQRLYKILFVRVNNLDNSLCSTSRNATIIDYGAGSIDMGTFSTSIYAHDEKTKLFATQQETHNVNISTVDTNNKP